MTWFQRVLCLWDVFLLVWLVGATGVVLAGVGTAMALGSLGGLLGLVIGTAAVLRKMAIEERLLAARFGDAHAVYRGRVKRLIPFVW